MLAAGKGLRFSLKHPKPLVNLKHQPVIIYCLKVFNRHPEIKNIILVANALNKGHIIAKLRQYKINKVTKVILGGRRRQDSVFSGLKALDAGTDLVLIHDGVRPFITQDMVSSLIKEAKKSSAAIAGVPVKATIKAVDSRKSLVVSKTLDRKNLWEIQTPQVFRRDLILKAYKKFGRREVTDDAMLVEKLGAKVSVVLGSYNNIKITTAEDLVIAEAIARNRL